MLRHPQVNYQTENGPLSHNRIVRQRTGTPGQATPKDAEQAPQAGCAYDVLNAVPFSVLVHARHWLGRQATECGPRLARKLSQSTVNVHPGRAQTTPLL